MESIRRLHSRRLGLGPIAIISVLSWGRRTDRQTERSLTVMGRVTHIWLVVTATHHTIFGFFFHTGRGSDETGEWRGRSGQLTKIHAGWALAEFNGKRKGFGKESHLPLLFSCLIHSRQGRVRVLWVRVCLLDTYICCFRSSREGFAAAPISLRLIRYTIP